MKFNIQTYLKITIFNNNAANSNFKNMNAPYAIEAYLINYN